MRRAQVWLLHHIYSDDIVKLFEAEKNQLFFTRRHFPNKQIIIRVSGRVLIYEYLFDFEFRFRTRGKIQLRIPANRFPFGEILRNAVSTVRIRR